MNFGSKLNRVKLQADRLFLRGDRTDVIGELRYAEEHAEELRLLCEAFARALEKRLNTHMVTEEKKHRKVPENQVAETLKDALREVSQNQPEDINEKEKTIFKTTIEEIVAVEQLLGKEVLDHEDSVEVEILAPFHKLLRDDFPSIAKQKKALKQAGQDVDAAKAKLRSSHSSVSQPNKIDSYKEELEDAESKLDQIKDSYACDLFNILAKQREIVRLCNLYLEMKVEFLQKSLHRLNGVLPPIRKILDDSTCSPVYGVPLYEHLRITQQEIAVPIQVCVRRLVEYGMFEEGLLRVAGSSTKIRRLKGLFDAGLITMDTALEQNSRDYDVNVVAGAFKGYLRELPEPLLTHTKHDELVEAVRRPDHKEKLRHMWQVVNALPTPNYNNLRYVVKFLAMLSSFSQENKMTPNNIAIVMAPNLVGAQRDPESGELASLGRNMTLGNDYRVAVEQLIEYSDYFFKGDVDFGVSPHRLEPPPSPKTGHNLALTANGAHFAKAGSHRRTESTDFGNMALGGQQPQQTPPQSSSSSSSLVAPESESPKQPHRQKKKPAPLPPQGEASTAYPLSHSPELSRSKTPPFNAVLSSSSAPSSTNPLHSPSPAPRLQYTNSLRRPTAEPPKPPGGTGPPTKPPRPNPPSMAADLQGETKETKPPRPCPPVSKESKGIETLITSVAPIGFENVLEKNPTDVCSVSPNVGITSVSTNGPAKEDEGSDREVTSIGFVLESSVKERVKEATQMQEASHVHDVAAPKMSCEVELKRGTSGGGTDPEFRKSLEGVLKHQPQVHTRHLVKPCLASDETSGESQHENKTPVALPAFPVPAQRSTRESSLTERPEPAPRSDKPAIPEKPATINRAAILPVDHCRQGMHDRPIAIGSKLVASSSSLNQALSHSTEKLEMSQTSGEHRCSADKPESFHNHDASCPEKPSKPPKPLAVRSSLEGEVFVTATSDTAGEQQFTCSNEETKSAPPTVVPPQTKPSDTTHL